MLQSVDTGERSLEAYRGVAPDDTLAQVRIEAERLRGARVLHINATPYGGGVSELLRSTVPLLNDLGLIADWRIISGDEAFFQATKAMHNGLQGEPAGLTHGQRETYLANARRNAQQLEERYDFIFVHDPLGDYDAVIYTMSEFVAPDLPVARVQIVSPAIDPLSPKNMELPDTTSREVLEWVGVHPERPLITQVSRFDPWKDPLGVIAAYRLVREDVPNLQLVLAGSMALDDPEGWRVYREISAEAADDPKIRLLTNLTGVGNVEVNALQRLSDVVVQKSLREGFGLVVSEALWKRTPVVAGRAGGIPLQMADGVGGALIHTVDGCVSAVADLLR